MNQALVTHATDGLAAPGIHHLLTRVQLIQEVMEKVMKEDIHYGKSFPGDTKKNLLKPGADSICVAFQLAPEFEVDERELGGDHREYRVFCRLKTQATGIFIAQGVGTCSSKESKYRYRNGQRKCPKCEQPTIIAGRKEYAPKQGGKAMPGYEEGGWLCWKNKGGCGGTWPNGDKSIEGQQVGKVENTDPADVWNTCLKIAKKRAFVDASITAVGSSDMFTQDLEDISDEVKRAAPVTPKAEPKESPGEEDQRPDEEKILEEKPPVGKDSLLDGYKADLKKCATEKEVTDLYRQGKTHTKDNIVLTEMFRLQAERKKELVP